jgi:hypothetical protein
VQLLNGYLRGPETRQGRAHSHSVPGAHRRFRLSPGFDQLGAGIKKSLLRLGETVEKVAHRPARAFRATAPSFLRRFFQGLGRRRSFGLVAISTPL